MSGAEWSWGQMVWGANSLGMNAPGGKQSGDEWSWGPTVQEQTIHGANCLG